MNYVWQILITGMLGTSVFLLAWSVGRLPVEAEPPSHRRFAAAVGSLKQRPLFEHTLLSGLMNQLYQLARRLPVANLRKRIRQDLDAAGNPNGYSADEYLAICLLCGLATVLGTSVLMLLIAGDMGLLTPLFTGLLGFGFPIWLLHNEGLKRAQRIGRQLPYTLDLVALMMAAGSTFTEAVNTLIADNPQDDFNQELRIVLMEIEFGAKRATALTNLAERIPLEALRSIIGAVNQAEMLGTPLSEILKSQSNMLRMYRSVRAEKLAASASLRILVPSMLILLAAVLFVFAPMILQWYRGGLM